MPTTELSLLPFQPPVSPATCRVRVAPAAGGGLALVYRLVGDPAAWRLPSAGRGERRDGLWRHTCCELFVMAGAGPGYREFNFSPAGDWAAYAFTAYRAGSDLEAAVAPRIEAWPQDSGLEVRIHLPAANLPPAPWRLGLSLVLEAAAGGLSYWALAHPAEKPDFHHPAGFTLAVSPLPPSPAGGGGDVAPSPRA